MLQRRKGKSHTARKHGEFVDAIPVNQRGVVRAAKTRKALQIGRNRSVRAEPAVYALPHLILPADGQNLALRADQSVFPVAAGRKVHKGEAADVEIGKGRNDWP